MLYIFHTFCGVWWGFRDIGSAPWHKKPSYYYQKDWKKDKPTPLWYRLGFTVLLSFEALPWSRADVGLDVTIDLAASMRDELLVTHGLSMSQADFNVLLGTRAVKIGAQNAGVCKHSFSHKQGSLIEMWRWSKTSQQKAILRWTYDVEIMHL